MASGGDYSVVTPERVSLQYDIAGIGSRGAAAIIDTTLQLVAMAVIGAALSGVYIAVRTFSSLGRGEGAGVLMLGLFGLGVLLVSGGYFILFEIVWSGQTPGKRMVGVRVMRENGYPLRPVDAVIRNLVRVVDWLPGIYGVGVLTMLLNKRSKRLGDFAGGTIVVREGSRGPGTILAPGRLAQSDLVLSNADATLVRDFLMRRTSMQTVARAEFAQRLAAALAQRYGLPVEWDPETFLERLAA